MAGIANRLQARLSPDERGRIERAAATTGVSVSEFVVGAAVDRADHVIAEMTTTIVPADYFDDLLMALDEPADAPNLARAAGRSS